METLQFRGFDAWVVVIYLLSMVAIGFYFIRRNKTTEAYFVGNRGFAGWALGISMLGTIVSSATFLALPAAAYILDWRQFSVNLALPLVAVLAIIFFVPIFRRSGITTAFEYLGMRYGRLARIYGTLVFIVMQLIRSAQVLFLMALPIHFLTGTPIHWVIIGTGLFVAIYTVAGGITTVIWTTVIQTLVMLVGGIICVVYITISLPDGLVQVFELGAAEDKFSLGDYNWDLAERTFWTVALLGLVNWLTIYGGDQNMVQRYASARSTREARKAVVVYTTLALPIWALFFFVGTCLFAYYRVFPNEFVDNLAADEVLPFFILTRIPDGLSGLIIAAIVAAAMSTLGACINAISTVTVVDLLKPFILRNKSDRFYLFSAVAAAAVAAVLIVMCALFFSYIPKESMNDISLIVTSVFGGCVMGLFMLGFFTRRVNGFAVNIALVAASLFNVYLGLSALGLLPGFLTLPVHSYWVGALVNLLFILLAFAIVLIRRTPPSEFEGLTVWSMPKEEEIK